MSGEPPFRVEVGAQRAGGLHRGVARRVAREVSS